MIQKLGLVLHHLVSPPSRVPVHWTSAALHKLDVLVSLRRHVKTQRDRADVSCQNINSDKACPAAKLSSSSSICRAIRPDVHGFHHAKTMARDCLARSTTCTKRASLAPALLALLWLRHLAAATLRERPVLLLLDEVAELLLPPVDL